jgi:hypothetical protein
MTGAMNVFVGTYNRPFGVAFGLMLTYLFAVSIVSLFWHPAFLRIYSLFASTSKSA